MAVHRDPFPVEAARDLLGLVRSLYAAAKQREAGKRHLAPLAERATSELGTLVDVYASVLPTVQAATLRVLQPKGPRKAEASKIERRRVRG